MGAFSKECHFLWRILSLPSVANQSTHSPLPFLSDALSRLLGNASLRVHVVTCSAVVSAVSHG